MPFTSIRIGDGDGFGFGSGGGLLNFEGNPVNVDGLGPLRSGDFLPDRNQDGQVKNSSGDDFDNRTAGEVSGTSLTGSGFTNVRSSGSQFTDLSLSQNYDTTGFPNPFPDSTSNDRNNASFVFDFTVDENDISAGDQSSSTSYMVASASSLRF